jgi:hypothetical protein
MSSRVHRTLAVALGLLAALATIVALPARAGAAPYCGITWGSGGKSVQSFSQAPLISTRTGRHDCFDRVVFEFDGKASGYKVEYVDQVRTDGAGAVLPVAGGAKLRVSLLAPAYNQSGETTYPRRSGDHVANVAGYQTLRDVVYGGSFEGYTTFGVGVRARLPFRVFVLAGPDTRSRIVVDVAHRW